LHNIIPGLTRVAILGAKTDPFTAPYVQDFQVTAPRNGLQVQAVLVDGPQEFDAAFAEIGGTGARAVVIQPLFQPYTTRIVELGIKHHLAVMSSYRDTTQAGGRISYSADHAASLLSELAGIRPVHRAISWDIGQGGAGAEIRLPGRAVPIRQGPRLPARS
jgi:hypothetical protein